MEGLYRQWDHSLFQKYIEDFQLPIKQKIKHYSRGMTMKLITTTKTPNKNIIMENTFILESVA